MPPGLSAGTIVDRYVVEGLIGSGGMASVYRVRHAALGSTHALKILRSRDARIVARFMLEGRAQSGLRHPNLVAVTDVVETAGQPALVLEFVEGSSLADLLAEGPVPVGDVDRIGRDVLRGMIAAHAAGFVHRDLKPGNVLLTVSGDHVLAKVADFGLAKAMRTDSDPTTPATRVGARMGTPAYMAPEQIRDASGVDHRADVFALGAVLYELCTGKRAFPGDDDLEVYGRIAVYDPPSIASVAPHVPARMAEAVRAALVKDPAARVGSCEALLALWSGSEPLPMQSGPELLARVRAITRGITEPEASSDTYAPESTATWGGVSAAAEPPPSTQAAERPSRAPWLALAGLLVVVASVAVWWALPDASPALTVALAPLRVTPVEEQGGTLSLDGQRLAWSADGRLRIAAADGTGARDLTAGEPSGALEPAFSPDGAVLAFAADGGLYTVPADGGEPTLVVAGAARSPTWSPDGAWIAWSTGRHDMVDANTERATLHAINVTSGEARQLTAAVEGVGPQWGADGWIVASGRDGLFAVRPDGTGLAQIATGALAYARHGDALLYVTSDRTDVLYAARFHTDPPRLGEPVTVFQAPEGAQVAHLSVVGDAIVAMIGRVDDTVSTFPFDPETLTLGPSTPLTGARRSHSPAYGAGGLAVASTSDGSQEFVEVVGPDGARRTVTPPCCYRGPMWSPDGRSLLTYGFDRKTGLAGIWRVELDAPDPLGALETLHTSDTEELWVPQLSPDGRRLSFVIVGAVVTPVVVDPDAPIAPQIASQRDPSRAGWIPTSWSPDGRYLSVTRLPDTIGRMDATTGDVEVLSNRGYYSTFLDDGRLLVALDDTLRVVDVATRLETEIARLPGKIPLTPSVAVRPDRRELAIATMHRESDVWTGTVVGR